MAAQYFAERFRAAIVYYPNCVIPAPSMTAPTLILIGEAGRRIGARCCRERHGCAIFRRTRFRAAIVYYPNCVIPAPSMTAPTLILIGEADEASPVEPCREMVAHARPDAAPIALTVYPGVHHNFDVAQLTPGVRHFGHWLEYNEPAAK